MAKKQVRLQEQLCPGEGKLRTSNGVAMATILDLELDPIECSFNSDGSVDIDTTDLTYITLSLENINQLKKLITQAEKFYEKEFEKRFEEED